MAGFSWKQRRQRDFGTFHHASVMRMTRGIAGVGLSDLGKWRSQVTLPP